MHAEAHVARVTCRNTFSSLKHAEAHRVVTVCRMCSVLQHNALSRLFSKHNFAMHTSAAAPPRQLHHSGPRCPGPHLDTLAICSATLRPAWHSLRPICVLRLWISEGNILIVKAWNSQAHREFHGKFESSNLSNDHLSREIGRRLAWVSFSGLGPNHPEATSVNYKLCVCLNQAFLSQYCLSTLSLYYY